jgi:hypothetical protein
MLSAISLSRAEILVQYGFEGQVLSPASTHANASASDFSYTGPSTATNFVLGSGGSGTYAYSSRSWTGSVTNGYFGFSVSIDPGFIVDVSDLSFEEQRSGSGPTNWSVFYSTNGTAFLPLGAGDSGAAGSFHSQQGNDTEPYDLSGTVYFRIYAINASDGNGTWRLDDVTLNGTLEVDDGTRVLRFQGFDGSVWDNWAVTTNTSGTAVVETSADRSYQGIRSQKIAGSNAEDVDPYIQLANTAISPDASNVVFSIAYSADGPDSGDDLHAFIAYDGGSIWAGAGSTKLVDGYSQADVAFGATNASNPTTESSNPYSFSVSGSETQIAVQVQFHETSGNDNTNDFYYVDSVKLEGIPVPSDEAPTINNYTGASGETASQAILSGQVVGGYPYPNVTVYWGPADGGMTNSGWSGSTNLGVKTWGNFSATITGLTPGQVYYYRCFAENSGGSDWSDDVTSFSTDASALGSAGRIFIDSFAVGTNMPMSIDVDGNGLSDRWEDEFLGGTGNAAGGDEDGDGVSNEREGWAGTDPDDTNSYMRIGSFDLSSETSSDIRIEVYAGDSQVSSMFAGDTATNRLFTIRAANNDSTSGKNTIGSVQDNSTGTNVYTDSNAVNLYSSRYYNVSVALGGNSYTNTQEWAMYVQDRAANERFLMSVPVDYSSSSENNLNSSLGRQLARGLHADTTTNAADVLRFLSGTGTWEEFYLFTNASGMYWYDPDTLTTADVQVTAGQALWIKRGSGSVIRPNAVFAAGSFSDLTVTNFTFNTNYGGWTMFGWPLGETRGHSSTNAATDQLGFYSLGVGGHFNPSRTNEIGDQIWVWKDNTWKNFYMLLDNIGPGWNGRWYNYNKQKLADFQFEPGGGYYYRHSTNSGGTNFTWTPEIP